MELSKKTSYTVKLTDDEMRVIASALEHETRRLRETTDSDQVLRRVLYQQLAKEAGL